ncbi:hypothetical protein A2U01_0086748, partial [Trifolium medium]|nr:hypothetical protein [Trifolium medium]
MHIGLASRVMRHRIIGSSSPRLPSLLRGRPYSSQQLQQ